MSCFRTNQNHQAYFWESSRDERICGYWFFNSWSTSDKFFEHFGVRPKKSCHRLRAGVRCIRTSLFQSQPLRASPYRFLCKVWISRSNSLAIRKRDLSRDSTFGVVRRAFQSKGLLLAVDLEYGRVLRRGTRSPTLAVTTWLIVS